MKHVIKLMRWSEGDLNFMFEMSREVPDEGGEDPDPTSHKKLLVLVSQRVYGQLKSEIDAWVEQVNHEEIYTPIISVTANSWADDPDRLAKVTAVRKLIADYMPDAVQIFGSVATPITGWFNQDGHGARAAASDGIYMLHPATILEDKILYGINQANTGKQYGLWNNHVADGKYDLKKGDFYLPVARVDFSELGEKNPTQLVTTGCAAGQKLYYAIDEIDGLRKYLARNMEYRRTNAYFPQIGMMHGGLWRTQDLDTFKQQMSGVQWAWSQAPANTLARRFYVFAHNTQGDYWYLERASVNGKCVGIESLIRIAYKSFTTERFYSGGPAARALEYGLVNLFAKDEATIPWRIPPDAQCVADMISASLASQKFSLYLQVLGDLTLPFK